MVTTIEAIEIDEIRDLVRPTDSAVAVYLGPPTDPADDLAQELVLRRRRIAGQLADQGAPASLIDTVSDFLNDLPEYSAECAVFVGDDRVVAYHPLPGAVATDLVRYAAPVPVAPLLRWYQSHPAYVRVVADRTGADLLTFRNGALTAAARTVIGPDDDIRRHFPGGGQAPRLRRRAEDSWHHNAMAIAAAVHEEAQKVHAGLVLLSGDGRITRMVGEALSHEAQPPRVVDLPGSRHGSGPAPDQVTAAVAAQVEGTTEKLLHRVSPASGPHGSTVSGLAGVLNALSAGLVDTLLVGYRPDDRRAGWFGPHLLASRQRPSHIDGGSRRGHAVDIAIRAALLTRASIRILTPTEAAALPDGIAAIGRTALDR
jgi:hypothetical protein